MMRNNNNNERNLQNAPAPPSPPSSLPLCAHYSRGAPTAWPRLAACVSLARPFGFDFLARNQPTRNEWPFVGAGDGARELNLIKRSLGGGTNWARAPKGRVNNWTRRCGRNSGLGPRICCGRGPANELTWRESAHAIDRWRRIRTQSIQIRIKISIHQSGATIWARPARGARPSPVASRRQLIIIIIII